MAFFAGLPETILGVWTLPRNPKIKLGVDSTAKPLAWVLPVDVME
jgi:hypothetical protein